ncbi:MAG: antibiotic biosynthesis monooxygenase [Burkholderiales bacterium]|nr:antibiotic biosynthesis monooxygenase [Anaerolineae bacterium]
MYAQSIVIQVPLGKMVELRTLIESQFMAAAHTHPGFHAAYLLEQEDDPNVAQLVQIWDSQDSIEGFRRTGTLDDINHKLHAHLPGLRTQQQGYIIRAAAAKPSIALDADETQSSLPTVSVH